MNLGLRVKKWSPPRDPGDEIILFSCNVKPCVCATLICYEGEEDDLTEKTYSPEFICAKSVSDAENPKRYSNIRSFMKIFRQARLLTTNLWAIRLYDHSHFYRTGGVLLLRHRTVSSLMMSTMK